LKSRLAAARRLVVVGGGYIGLELAASARTMGIEVTVLEAAERLLKRVAPPVVGEFLRSAHERRGVSVHLGTMLARIVGTADHVTGVELADGRHLNTDVVVIGIGSRPRTELARHIGLAMTPAGAIEVDEHMVTSDARVLAVGDCVAAPDPAGGAARMQIPSIQNALSQGAVAASTIVGKAERQRTIPWFWSDQFDIKLQIAGHGVAHDDVVMRGDPASERFAAFSYRDGRIASAAVINRPTEFMQARKCIEMNLSIDRAIIADESLSLSSLLKAQAQPDPRPAIRLETTR
jgi:3-phenylpropionate/trans-cinnamate dioxygenase ferredoxin reductase subunit